MTASRLLLRSALEPMVSALQHLDNQVRCKAAHALGTLTLSSPVAQALMNGPLAKRALEGCVPCLAP